MENTCSVSRSEISEVLVAQLRRDNIVFQMQSPHVNLLFNTRTLDGVIPRTLRDGDQASHSQAIYMELAENRDVFRAIENCRWREWGLTCDEFFIRVLFQVCFTLVAIYNTFPNFRHNDLKPSNVMLQVDDATGYTRYAWRALEFRVPRSKFSTAIGDFDLSSICGVVDNYKLIDLAVEQPTLNINTRANFKHDIYFFTLILYDHLRVHLSRDTRERLFALYGGHAELFDAEHIELRKQNNRRPVYSDYPKLITAQEMLGSPHMFGCFWRE